MVVGALAKYDRLESHFAEARMRSVARRPGRAAPAGLAPARRDGFVVLSLAEVAYFRGRRQSWSTRFTRDARRFGRSTRTLAELEAELGAEFFRVNRQLPGVRRRGRRVSGRTPRASCWSSSRRRRPARSSSARTTPRGSAPWLAG